jgi:hypothetical protein
MTSRCEGVEGDRFSGLLGSKYLSLSKKGKKIATNLNVPREWKKVKYGE